MESSEDCFANSLQDFLVCTTVHKAKEIAVATGDTYVRVTLGKIVKNTKKSPPTANPFFNEYFVFELRCTLTELLRYTIIYELRKHSLCSKDQTISELLVDLQSLWNQPNRCFYKKWGRLETPLGVLNSQYRGTNGHLQLDLVIVAEGNDASSSMPGIAEVSRWHVNQDFDDIESNLLESVKKVKINCNVRYSVYFYHANLNRKGDYLLQVSFAGNHGKTKVCKGTDSPLWNQEITFTWMYPSLAQIFLIQLYTLDHCCWRSIADYELHFDEIAFDAMPTIGPTYVQLYGASKPLNYVGRLLMEIRSECITVQLVRELIVRDAPPIDERSWWQEEAYTIEFIALQGYFYAASVPHFKIAIKIADLVSDQLDCHLLPALAPKTSQLPQGLKYFTHVPPYKAIHIKIKLPDLLEKYDGDFFIQEIIEGLREDLETFRVFQLKYNQEFVMQAKCLSAITLAFCTKLRDGIDGKRLQYHQHTERTTWDNNRNEYLESYFSRLHDRVRATRQKLRLPYMEFIEQEIEKVLLDLQHIIVELSGLLQIIRVQDEWPELYLVLSAGSCRDLGICRLNAKNYVDIVPNPSIQRKLSCWKLKSFVFKKIGCPHTCINCGCIVGIVQGCLGIIADGSRRQFLNTVLKQWKQTEPLHWSPIVTYTTFNCRIFVHQAKVRPCPDNNGVVCNAQARVAFCAHAIETTEIKGTLSPIWNMVFAVDNLRMPGGISWYIEHPPLLAVELYDRLSDPKDAYLGSAVCAVSILNSTLMAAAEQEPVELDTLESHEEHGHMLKTKDAFQKFQILKSTTPPPLKWLPISVNGSVRAELLISAELVATQKTGRTPEPSVAMTMGIPFKIRPVMQNFVLEVVFVGFRNYKRSSCCACAERHRCKLMLGELVLKSGLTTSRLRQSMNFFVMYASGVVSLPCQMEYWPAMVVTDFTECLRGRESTIGATLIPDCRRFVKRNKPMASCPSSAIANSECSDDKILPFEEDSTLSEDHNPLLRKRKRFGKLKQFLGYWHLLCAVCPWPRRKVKADEEALLKHDAKEINYNWWTKFYNSLYLDVAECPTLRKHRLTIYYTEIEKMPEFNYFHDWAVPVKLVHGIKYKKHMHPREETYATLKLNVKLTPCQCSVGEADGDGNILRPLAGALNARYQQDIQALAELCKITVRVYVVQCLNLRWDDKLTQSDSYVRCQLGTVIVSNRAQYVPNKSNPIFGTCFQLDGLLPREHLLEISVFNRENSHEDLIGSTVIDLEDRWRSRHRCTMGIAREYCQSGYNKWRDMSTPLEILKELCMKHQVAAPQFQGATVEVDGMVFSDQTQLAKDEDLYERLSLTVLRNLEALHSFGYTLMPEHVETRTLYRNSLPGVPQGKIQLWLELYEANMNLPAILDITPEPPSPYELRIVVHGCVNVKRQELGCSIGGIGANRMFGTQLSDMFVRGWCSAIDQAQSTDIHYRSLNGEAQFNWRMIFPLKYSTNEDMMVVKRKSTVQHEQFEMKQPPILYIQVLSDEVTAQDDYLGMLEINLSNFSEPAMHPKQVQAMQSLNKDRKAINLFTRKIIRGWFPLHPPQQYMKTEHAADELTGKIELELEICTPAEAALNPVGLGREAPNALQKPKRPTVVLNFWQRLWKKLQKLFTYLRKTKVLLIVLTFVICLTGLILYLTKITTKGKKGKP